MWGACLPGVDKITQSLHRIHFISFHFNFVFFTEQTPLPLSLNQWLSQLYIYTPCLFAVLSLSGNPSLEHEFLEWLNSLFSFPGKISENMAIVTGDRYLESLVKFVEKQAGPLIEGSVVLKLNPVGLHYVQSRLEALHELESLLAGAPVDYLRAYISDLGDHRALEQLRRILRLLTSLKVVSVLPPSVRDPTRLSLLPFGRLRVLELRGCDLSTSAARGLLELRHTLEKIICHNSTVSLLWLCFTLWCFVGKEIEGKVVKWKIGSTVLLSHFYYVKRGNGVILAVDWVFFVFFLHTGSSDVSNFKFNCRFLCNWT